MIFDLVKDFAEVLDAMPKQHPRRRILKLLDEAIRRDVHFINRHPTTLFQCLWNTCWWYDCPEAAKHYDVSEGDGTNQPPPWKCGGQRLSDFLEGWRTRRKREAGGQWVRSLRPPFQPLRSGQMALYGHSDLVGQLRISADGSRLLGIALNGSAVLWEFPSGKLLGRVATESVP